MFILCDSSDETDDNLKLILTEASNFAYQLLKKWKLGRCTDDVLILYSVMDGVVSSLQSRSPCRNTT